MDGLTKRVNSAGSFKTMVGRRPSGWDPSTMPRPAHFTASQSIGVIMIGNRPVSGLMISTGTNGGVQGAFKVASHDFSTGPVTLTLGKYQITSTFDFAPGVSAAACATNIAAAINKLSGFSAVTEGVGGVDVLITANAPADFVQFSALQLGTSPNFTEFSPANGFLGGGSPYASNPPIPVVTPA